MIETIAHAKINLYLHVTGKRADGYHLLDSLFAFTDFGDQLTVSLSNSLSLSISGLYQNELSGYPVTDNLIYRAADLLKTKYHIASGAHIELTKNIPVCAGLGGGSADAAAAFLALNRLWSLDLSLADMAELAIQLGADIPSCLYQTPLLVSGIGEKIEPTKLPKQQIYILLVNPNQPLSTAVIFEKLGKDLGICEDSPTCLPSDLTPFLDFIKHRKNDLEPVAIECLPEINSLLTNLARQSGCHLARMSGSGPTCFGLFLSKRDALFAQENIQKLHRNYWSHVTHLLA